MRAVIYARYASDVQNDRSIEEQVRVCTALIDREGGTLISTYADRAMSGARLESRADMQRLLADAKNRRFDTVIAEGLDRLSRNQEDIAGIYKLLTCDGVRIVTLQDGLINELHIGLKGTMNVKFLRDYECEQNAMNAGNV